MAFTTILRRSVSSALPLAARAVQGNHHQSALFTAIYHSCLSHKPSPRPFALTLHFYSSSAKRPSSDETLTRVIESEIKCAEESDDHEAVEGVPSGFPFKIQDNPGRQTISLIREYEGEVIEVEAHMFGEDDDTDDDNDDDNDDDEKGNQCGIEMYISVTKKNGLYLGFFCTASADSVRIDSVSLKGPETSYEGPNFADLDENLQKALHKYLTTRGINPSTAVVLHDYLIDKDNREYLVWLNNLKKFVEA